MIICIVGHCCINLVQVVSWQILYSWRFFVLTVIFIDHMQDMVYSTTSSPQKSQQSSRHRYCLKDMGATQPLCGSGASSSTPIQGHECGELVLIDQLMVVDHIIHQMWWKYLLGK